MIVKVPFGRDVNGEPVSKFHLENSKKEYIDVLDYGCTLQSIVVMNKEGNMTDVCLGYDKIREYERNDGFLGCIVGRHANRIGGASFNLRGVDYPLEANNGANHLHGGSQGFDKYIWNSRIVGESVEFTRLSKDMEAGYPGNLTLKVIYSFDDDANLTIKYEGVCDKDTVLNLTNHCYFNLKGKGDIENHFLQLNSNFYTENNIECMPTGVISRVDNTPMDFRNGKALGADLYSEWDQIKAFNGFDHNFILSDTQEMKNVGKLWCLHTGIEMNVATTKPAVQIYTANALTERYGKDGATYQQYSGVCLETQLFPNSTAISHFPTAVLKGGQNYRNTTVFSFSVMNNI